MADMGTRLAAEKWGVSQKKVQLWCKKMIITDKRITQDKKGSPYHIPEDYPNPFTNTKVDINNI
jgi:hypothetical protein